VAKKNEPKREFLEIPFRYNTNVSRCQYGYTTYWQPGGQKKVEYTEAQRARAKVLETERLELWKKLRENPFYMMEGELYVSEVIIPPRLQCKKYGLIPHGAVDDFRRECEEVYNQTKALDDVIVGVYESNQWRLKVGRKATAEENVAYHELLPQVEHHIMEYNRFEEELKTYVTEQINGNSDVVKQQKINDAKQLLMSEGYSVG
jgi:uncharacterized protein YutD